MANMIEQQLGDMVEVLTNHCHGLAKEAGWWTDLATGESADRNFGECIALIHSELSEALEADRKGLESDHIEASGVAEELADALIRIFDLAGGYGINIGDAFAKKMAYNRQREDHRIESRLADNGKRY